MIADMLGFPPPTGRSSSNWSDTMLMSQGAPDP